jgi:histidinol dehydrogenase
VPQTSLQFGRIDLRGRAAQGGTIDYGSLVPRAEFAIEAAVEAIRPVVDDVAARGLPALEKYSEEFDGVVPRHFRVPEAELARAAYELDADLRTAFAESIRRRREVCAVERGEPESTIELAPGARVSQRLIPVDRVGLYVPGGRAPLASSVIMNVVPAQVAGVGSIAVASPPQAEFDGLPHPSILAVCHVLGVQEVYAVGGAQAIAMFGYGVDGLCEPVNVITGPGNSYVVAAKRLLRGRVSIDSEAGPTEIAVLADHTADPRFVAADLISQAEHAPDSASVLITADEALADAVVAELERQLPDTKHTDRILSALNGQQSGVVLVDDLDQGIAVADGYAAEHLEIHTEQPAAVAARIRNAGAIFLGSWAPVSLGDYSAGSTHVLPTGGCACHSAGLTVRNFVKAVHVIDYTEAALGEIAGQIEHFAAAEDLPSHGAAVSIRFQERSR